MAITGNKGEWSELYVFLRLLADGEIFVADENLNKINSMFFPISKIIREETIGKRKDYCTGSDVCICVDGKTIKIPSKRFSEEAEYLLTQIKTTSGKPFTSEKTEDFMKVISVERLKSRRRNKADIIIQIHDIQTGYKPEVGFSIKSKLGEPATLLNASKATNFIFKIVGKRDKLEYIKKNLVAIQGVKKPTNQNKSIGVKEILFEIEKLECGLKFCATDDRFSNNLMMTDSLMPIIISKMLTTYYSGKTKNTLKAIVEQLINDNPLSIQQEKATIFYTHKVKSLLCAIALGMVATVEWNGTDEATGGYIVVKENGDVVAYHIYNRDKFKDYLFINTKFETSQRFDSLPPSKKKGFDYGYIYGNDDKLFIKLNLQIRFL
jgi:type II restriction enzyme